MSVPRAAYKKATPRDAFLTDFGGCSAPGTVERAVCNERAQRVGEGVALHPQRGQLLVELAQTGLVGLSSTGSSFHRTLTKHAAIVLNRDGCAC